MAAIEQRLKAFSLYQLHGDVVEAVFFAGVEYHNDVGVGQQSSGARFGLEARQKFGTRESRTFFAQPDGFYRYGTPNDRVHSLVDNAHCAAAELPEEFVSSSFCYSWHHPINLSPRKSGTNSSKPAGTIRVAALEGQHSGNTPDLLPQFHIFHQRKCFRRHPGALS